MRPRHVHTLAGRKSRGDAWGALILLLVAIGAGGVWFLATRKGPDAGGCPVAGPTGLLAIVLDATDFLTEAQRIDVQNRLSVIVNDLPEGTMLQIWKVQPTAEILPTVSFEGRCKPDDDLSGVFTNAKTAKERLERFRSDVTETLATALVSQPQPQSPIMETLQGVSLRFFGQPALAGIADRQLVLVSDLIQNTPAHSQLGTITPYETFKADPVATALLSDLRGVRVKVLMLSRAAYPGNRARVLFWERFFLDAGARLEAVDRIAG